MITAGERLQRLLDVPDASINLPEAALVVATEQYPDLQVGEYLSRIAVAADQLRRRIPNDAGKAHILGMLNHMMFTELGYSGAGDDYYDPRNSFLNDVMERRIGIPITLSILYIAIGERVGLPLSGIGFPGHFLVRCSVDGGVLVLDPYNRGLSLSEEELRKRLESHGVQEAAQRSLAEFLQPASKRDILARLLRNLKSIYLESRDLDRAVAIMDLLLKVLPDAPQEVLARGMLYREMECFSAALHDLQRYCELNPSAEQDDKLQDIITQLRYQQRSLH